jgi:hypothetical protein
VDLAQLHQICEEDVWTAIILVFWCIWRHQNEVVFNGATPAAAAIRHKIREEYQRWRVARFFRSESFRFPEPFPFSWRDGGFCLVGELPPLDGSNTCGSVFLALYFI